MKKSFATFALILTTAVTSFATSPDPKQTFLDDAKVQEKIADARASGLTVDSIAEAATLASGCGFAGCDQIYFVTIMAGTRGTNRHANAISAVVRVSELGSSVTLIETEKVLELAQ